MTHRLDPPRRIAPTNPAFLQTIKRIVDREGYCLVGMETVEQIFPEPNGMAHNIANAIIGIDLQTSREAFKEWAKSASLSLEYDPAEYRFRVSRHG